MRSPRLTIRRLLLAVAIVGALLGTFAWERRRERYRRLAAFHRMHLSYRPGGLLAVMKYRRALAEWHAHRADQYARASILPWVSAEADEPKPDRPPEADEWKVEVDPPEPE